MPFETSGLETSSGSYNENSNAAIVAVLIFFSSTAAIVNFFAVISIVKHNSSTITNVLVCCLSSVELLHAVACGITTSYSYYKTQHSFEKNSLLCTFYAWLYIAFRTMATLLVSLLLFDRVILSLNPKFYVQTWTSKRFVWILPSSAFILALLLASSPLIASSYVPSPDAKRFHCLFRYAGPYAVFYISFNFGLTFCSFVSVPWVLSREKHVDAKLSVLLVGEMVVCRQGKNVAKVRDGLKISCLVSAVVLFYHACSVLLPLLLLLRFLDVVYPSVVGIIAIQLPTFGATFLPVIYGFTWKPYRRSYYSFVASLCPSSRKTKPKRVHSKHNPAFIQSLDFDGNSILHANGITLQQSASPGRDSQSMNSSRSKPLELSTRKLVIHPSIGTSDVSPRAREVLPSTTSFQDRHFYVPSKFQNIFEIIDALSRPHRNASEYSSECSSTENASPDELDSLSSLGASSPLKLNDVCIDLPQAHPNSFSDVDFSSIHVSSSPYNQRMVDKVKLDFERKNSFKDLHSEERYRRYYEEPSSPPGQIRFTDLKKVRAGTVSENLGNNSELANQERLLRYLASERYIDNT